MKKSRRRLVGLEALAGLAVAASLALLALLLALLIIQGAGELSWLQGVIWGALLLGLLAAVYFYGVRPIWRLRPAARLAREVERRLGGPLRLELVSAVQLETALLELKRRPTVSPELVEAHLDRVASSLQAVDIKSIVPGRRLKRPAGLLAVLAAATLVFYVLYPAELAGAAGALLRAPQDLPAGGGAPEDSWVGDIRLAYEYPAYSGRKRRVVEGTDGTILALPGTRVTIESRADRDLARAGLKLDDGTLPLRTAPGRRLEGEMVVMKAGSYRFELQDKEGRRFTERRPHAINLEADQHPQVRLTQPQEDLVVREQDVVDLLYDARDDFGLQEIRLAYRIGGRTEGEQRRVLQRFAKATRKVNRHEFGWDLASLQLEPGDTVMFYIEGIDSDTVMGPKAGRSSSRTLKVFSAREHHQKLNQRAQDLWEKLLSLLGDALDLDPRVQEHQKPQAGLEPFSNMHRNTESFLGELARLTADMRRDQLGFKPLLAALQNISAAVSQLNRELDYSLQRRQPGRDPDFLGRMLQAHQQRRVQRMERDVLYLEDLLDLMRLEDLEQIARELDQARRRLEELMQKYAEAPTDEVRRQIEAEIARLKDRIQKLLARQAEVLKSIRDEYLNPEALSKMLSERDMMGTLDRIQKLMMEGKMDQAMAELARLQKQLGSLQAAIDRSRAQYGMGKYAELAQAMARLQGELNMITEAQRKLMDETGRVRQRLIDQLKKTGQGRLKELFAKLRARLKNLVSQVEGIERSQTDNIMSRDIEEILREASMLDMLLKALDVAGSLDTAEKLARLTERLERSLMGFARYEGRFDPTRRKKLESYHRRSQEADREAQAILEELKKIMPDASRLLSRRDLDRLKKMSRRQEELKSRLQALQLQMRSINDQAPVFGQGAMGLVQRGGTHMQRAASDLAQNRPRGAYPHQQSAMSELEALQKALQQSCRQQGG